jgi:hypothetical protein
MPPKVFVSHASEDKERFVIPFATALREKGIDAWVDRWEMRIGDSLVDKIFEEGLKEASAVIIVLSSNSVAKSWVREELNAAFVSRMEKGTRIIPIVLDNCDVPEALKHLLWETVHDIANFDATLNRVVDEIFEQSAKPPLGAPPVYFGATSTRKIGGLTTADSVTLEALYRAFLSQPASYVEANELRSPMREEGLSEEIILDSLAVLEHKGFVEAFHTIGGPGHFRLTSYGVSAVLGDAEAGLIRSVGFRILNDRLQKAAEIAVSVNEPLPLVEHAIERLEADGHLLVSKYISEPPTVILAHPTLRRYLADSDPALRAVK